MGFESFPPILSNRKGWGIVAYPVIQAIGRPDFEDVLRTGALWRSVSDSHSVRTNPVVRLAEPMGRALTLGAV